MAIAGPLKLNVQLLRGRDPAIGPGKAMVLEAVDAAGSISAAGRHLGMSYRRIWLLVDALNRDWRDPLVETRPGGGAIGGGGGGARLTPFGRAVLAAYRTVEARMVAAGASDELDWLLGAMLPAEEAPEPLAGGG